MGTKEEEVDLDHQDKSNRDKETHLGFLQTRERSDRYRDSERSYEKEFREMEKRDIAEKKKLLWSSKKQPPQSESLKSDHKSVDDKDRNIKTTNPDVDRQKEKFKRLLGVKSEEESSLFEKKYSEKSEN